MHILGAHKPVKARQLVEQQGCKVLLSIGSPYYPLPRGSFQKEKNLLRKATARTKETLVEAMGEALSAVTAVDARDFFDHAGYRRVGQRL